MFRRRTVAKGASHGFMMEMPKYQMPVWRDVALGLWQRAWIFLRRAGTIILVSTVVLWILLFSPKPPADAARPALDYSVAGVVSHHLDPLFRQHGRASRRDRGW